ncbi:Probable transcriptional regulatory protein HI_0315 [Actinobacillus equuli]|nr:Probable transcriptional regulatory protein HI_0315 [Actinobacillus equuli]
MTRDTINRAIERGVGGGDDTNMETKSMKVTARVVQR